MDISPELNQAAAYGIAKLSQCGNEIERLSDELKTIVLVYTAQGVIENGGLQFFFESDFPGKPTYQSFVEAYRRIGATECVTALESAIALFPFDDPQLDRVRRNEWLNVWYEMEEHPMATLHYPLWHSDEVWRLLEEYVKVHRTAFGPTEDS